MINEKLKKEFFKKVQSHLIGYFFARTYPKSKILPDGKSSSTDCFVVNESFIII